MEGLESRHVLLLKHEAQGDEDDEAGGGDVPEEAASEVCSLDSVLEGGFRFLQEWANISYQDFYAGLLGDERGLHLGSNDQRLFFLGWRQRRR